MPDYVEERLYLPDGCPRDDYNAYSFQVGVFYRGDGKWLVSHGGREAHRQLSQTKRWLWSPSKMNALNWCRFDFETACRLAEEVVNDVKVNGRTWQEWEDHFAKEKEKTEA